MVQSSYKNRKKNRKQSFKRKNTDGNRKVKFIEDDDDKMVGGDDKQIAIASYIGKYENEHPTLFAVLFGIYSNNRGAILEANSANCKEDNMCVLNAAIAKSKNIMKNVPDSPDKPTQGGTVTYVRDVIDYLAQNVFIPKGLIKNIHVQKDDDSWTKLTNNKFKVIPEKKMKGRSSRNKYPVNDGKVYTKDGIAEIGKIVANLNTPDKQDDISENIENLKKLVYQPSGAMGSDDFENVVQTLTVDNIKTTNLAEAFTKWKKDEITEDDTSHRRDLDFSEDSLTKHSLDIRKEKKQEKSSFGTGIANSSLEGASTPTRPQKLTGVQPKEAQLTEAHTNAQGLLKQIGVIANTKGGGESEVKKMKKLVGELSDIYYEIMNSSVVEQDKQRLRTLIKHSDEILKLDNFEEMSKRLKQ